MTNQQKIHKSQRLNERLNTITMDLADEDVISPFSREDAKNFAPYVRPLKSAAVLVSILYRDSTPYILLTKRTLSLSNHKGQIAFPGGRIDAEDISPGHAAMRETNEEIGISTSQIRLIGKLPLYETVTGYKIIPIVGELIPPYIFKKAKEEVDEIFELPFDFIMDLNNFKRESIIYEGEERDYWALPFNEFYIWGATAAILRELAGRLNQN